MLYILSSMARSTRDNTLIANLQFLHLIISLFTCNENSLFLSSWFLIFICVNYIENESALHEVNLNERVTYVRI